MRRGVRVACTAFASTVLGTLGGVVGADAEFVTAAEGPPEASSPPTVSPTAAPTPRASPRAVSLAFRVPPSPTVISSRRQLGDVLRASIHAVSGASLKQLNSQVEVGEDELEECVCLCARAKTSRPTPVTFPSLRPTAPPPRRYGFSAVSYHRTQSPHAVVFPLSTAEVAAVVRTCAEHRVNVIPRGGGTSLEGQVLPLRQGRWEEGAGGATPFARPTVILAMDRMNAVLEVHEGDLDARVQAGVGWMDLQRALAPAGLMFPVDPGPGAQIGGMCGTGCSGTHAVRHGAMKANVLSLTAVASDGTVFSTGARARKSVAGLDLTSLLIGSEGTLAIVTEAVLKLAHAPEVTVVVSTPFPTVRRACEAVAGAVAGGLPLAAAELMDGPMCGAVRANAPALLPAGAVPHVLWKLSGTHAAVADASARLRALVERAGGAGWAEADLGVPEGAALWDARKTALFSAAAAHPGAQTLVTDVCVPLGALPALLERAEARLAGVAPGAPAVYTVAHAGDGNAHHFVVYQPAQEAAAHELADWLAKEAIALGGTCTGEHGVGAGKLKHLLPELGPGNARVAAAIKAALDPGAILNPGKKIPPWAGALA